ncbi:hypothetical protein, partial [Arthrobacter sp. TB 26]|uniref:hypothetical protein n=1 Tax=Arthrobacter sp. TB 26 TaxID=494420 RepID=UPI001ED9C425
DRQRQAGTGAENSRRRNGAGFAKARPALHSAPPASLRRTPGGADPACCGAAAAPESRPYA